MAFPENPNPNYTHFDPLMDFELSDYLQLDGGDDDCGGVVEQEDCSSQSMVSAETFVGGSSGTSSPRSSNIKCKNINGVKKNKMEHRVAFRTKSELEVMDDGYKWRKYGKKSVKNSPNPRNYFKCSSGGCVVKKRVERDREDSSYVLTTYEGIHNHESPALVYYNQVPVVVPNGWTLQASSHSSTSS